MSSKLCMICILLQQFDCFIFEGVIVPFDSEYFIKTFVCATSSFKLEFLVALHACLLPNEDSHGNTELWSDHIKGVIAPF